jgi:ankyrin repeat protein
VSALHHAARAGDLPELERLLDAGTPVDLPGEEGYTALMVACLSDAAGVETLEFLITRGADVNAIVRPPGAATSGKDDWLDDCGDLDLDPETRATMEQGRAIIQRSQALVAERGEERRPTLSVAVRSATLEKLRLLIQRGADPAFTSSLGYTPMILAACAGRIDVIELLAAAGAPATCESVYGESPVRNLSLTGAFREVGLLLGLGADPAPLEWTPLHRAVALGSLEEVRSRLDEGADLEATDSFKRSAFLVAVHAGDLEKAALLLSRGANPAATGHCGRTSLHYPIDHDDAPMLRWLLGLGLDRDARDQFGHTPVMEAVEAGAVACFEVRMEAGANRKKGKYRKPLIAGASHPAIIRRLLDLGEDPGDLETEALRDWIGLGTRDEMPVTKAEFLRDRTRRFGSANPERMDIPFWRTMVRNGWCGYQAARHFGEETDDHDAPVWCHQRYGMSLTPLPDGRWVQIAGEHEDHYDPDFCIYNDVILHDGKGGFEILGYPEEVFPPTDFHSATLVGEWIYIIGNLSYPETRAAFGYETPVFRFHTVGGKIERVATSGESPGWIHDHQAKLDHASIRVFQGKVLTVQENGETDITGLRGSYALDLATGIWTKR